jgi:putative peptidoglycan lipid II flippase
VPCAAGAIAIPELVMRGLFMRGAFTAQDAAAAGATLAAYSIGLLPFVMLRSFTAPFYARGDTVTPVTAALLAVVVNVALKVLLMGSLAQVGLAFATSVGAWINLTLLWLFARRQGFAVSGAGLRPVLKLFGAGAILAVSLYFGARLLAKTLAGLAHFRDEISLVILLTLGAFLYVAVVLLLLGRSWLGNLFKDVGEAAETPLPKPPEPPDALQDSASLPDNTPPPNV